MMHTGDIYDAYTLIITFLRFAELRHVLSSLGEKLSDEEIDSLFANVDVDAGGAVNYEGVYISQRWQPGLPPLLRAQTSSNLQHACAIACLSLCSQQSAACMRHFRLMLSRAGSRPL